MSRNRVFCFDFLLLNGISLDKSVLPKRRGKIRSELGDGLTAGTFVCRVDVLGFSMA